MLTVCFPLPVFQYVFAIKFEPLLPIIVGFDAFQNPVPLRFNDGSQFLAFLLATSCQLLRRLSCHRFYATLKMRQQLGDISLGRLQEALLNCFRHRMLTRAGKRFFKQIESLALRIFTVWAWVNSRITLVKWESIA